ncbi:hypothetical protein STEG23_034573 [Scotinomys teguina]
MYTMPTFPRDCHDVGVFCHHDVLVCPESTKLRAVNSENERQKNESSYNGTLLLKMILLTKETTGKNSEVERSNIFRPLLQREHTLCPPNTSSHEETYSFLKGNRGVVDLGEKLGKRLQEKREEMVILYPVVFDAVED